MKTLIKSMTLFLIFTLSLPALAETTGGGEPKTFSRKKMLPGNIEAAFTIVALAQYGKEVEEVFQYTFDETSRIAEMFNTDNPQSELTQIAASSGKQPVKVSKEVFVIMEHAKEIAEWTRGAFDPVVGGSFKQLKLDSKNQTVFLKKAGSKLNLRGILEGFIADLFIRAAYHASIDDAFAEVGGVSRAMGTNPFGEWRVTIGGSSEGSASKGMTINLSNYSAATVGGSYSRPVTDSEGGPPGPSAFYSVTVLAPKAATAQGVATSIYHLPVRGGENLIYALGIRAVFAFPDGSIRKVGRW